MKPTPLTTGPSRCRTRLAALLVCCALTFAGAVQCRRAVQTQPNLILISLDTLRADHLGFYGYHRNTSPNLDALARRSLVFLDAHSTASKTAESHMSMFTSLYPSVHAVGTLQRDAEVTTLRPGLETLAELLQDDGYATVGYHDGGFVDGKLGFSRGFDSYENRNFRDAHQWLRENADDGKFFLFLHTYAVHDPYTPKGEFATMFDPDYSGRIVSDRDKLVELAGSDTWWKYTELYWNLVDKNDPRDVAHLEALYDGAIAQLDQDMAKLLETIEKEAPNTIVVILSDHGEEFGEHGKFRHEQLYQELTHIPLIIHDPRRDTGVTIDHPVSLIDLAPTLLELLGIEAIEQFQGRSLLRQLDGERVEILSEMPVLGLEALRDERWRLITTKERNELYDIVNDPKEKNDLTKSDAPKSPDAQAARPGLEARLGAMRESNATLLRSFTSDEKTDELDAATLDQLRALGYIK